MDVTVQFYLSDIGRKTAMAASLPAAKLQRVTVQDSENELLDIATIDDSGNPLIKLYFSLDKPIESVADVRAAHAFDMAMWTERLAQEHMEKEERHAALCSWSGREDLTTIARAEAGGYSITVGIFLPSTTWEITATGPNGGGVLGPIGNSEFEFPCEYDLGNVKIVQELCDNEVVLEFGPVRLSLDTCMIADLGRAWYGIIPQDCMEGGQDEDKAA